MSLPLSTPNNNNSTDETVTLDDEIVLHPANDAASTWLSRQPPILDGESNKPLFDLAVGCIVRGASRDDAEHMIVQHPGVGEHRRAEVRRKIADVRAVHSTTRPSKNVTLRPSLAKTSSKQRPELASIEVRDRAYRAFLGALSPRGIRDHLEGDGWTTEQINHAEDQLLYRWMPGRGSPAVGQAIIAARYAVGREALLGVPGFHLDEEDRLTVANLIGILIPVRDQEGRIHYLKLRRHGDITILHPDGRPKLDPKTKTPKLGNRYVAFSNEQCAKVPLVAHVPLHDGPVEHVTITEGEKKADLATMRGRFTISIPGVNSWKTSLPIIEKMWLTNVDLALDMDAETNVSVAGALRDLHRELSKRHVKVGVLRWRGAKGLDDALVKNLHIERITGTAIEEHFDGLPTGRKGSSLSYDEAVAAVESLDTPSEVAANNNDSEDAGANSKADRLADLLDELRIFRTSTGRFFAEIDGEAIPVDSHTFLSRVARLHRARHGELINKATFDSALLPLLGPHLQLGRAPVRFGGDERHIIIDLTDGTGAVVVIDSNGCSVVAKSPVCFYRPADTQPLPRPTFPSSDEQAAEWLGDYRDKILGVEQTTFVKIVAWQLSAMRPMESAEGALTVYTLLDLIGEEGSGKTTTACFIRRPLDPRRPLTDRLPKKDDDLPIQAENTAVLLFDNLSSIPQDLSDAFCRLATGDGDRRRSLYSNRDLSVFESSKPLILTSITNTITRPDLQDRALQAKLPARKKRIDEKTLMAMYSEMAPRIFGALCWCLRRGLANAEHVEVPDTIRMRAPAMIATAAETAAGLPKGSVVAAYERSKADGAEVTRLDPVYAALVRLLDQQLGDEWSGKTEQLLTRLTEDVREVNEKGHYRKNAPRGWPETPRGLTAALQRLERTLRLDGIVVTFPAGVSGTNRERILTVKRVKAAEQVAPEAADPAEEDSGVVDLTKLNI